MGEKCSSSNNNTIICDIPLEDISINPFTMVIFGGAGDLSKRKLLPTLFQIYNRGKLPEGFNIIAFGRQQLDSIGYRKIISESIREFSSDPVNTEELEEFLKNLWFHKGSFEDKLSFSSLKQELEKTEHNGKEIIYYLSVPGKLYPTIVDMIHQHDLNFDKNIKIIIEKPFGTSLKTAHILSKTLKKVFDENQIFRMDHYLGKETVQNIMFFRFANSIYEHIWNSQHIDSIQITVAEDLGVEYRGRFYEQTGVIRDIIQNHMMQLIALVAMEPPVSIEADSIRDEKVKVFKSIRKIEYDEVENVSLIGQYGRKGEIKGYREEENVSSESNIPTFFAGKFFIDNWRWAGVPFYVRSGKRLKNKKTEIAIQFKQPPLKLFPKSCKPLEPNSLILALQPHEAIKFNFGVKYPESNNMLYPVSMDFCYDNYFKSKIISPYERLLFDCLRGDQMLFVREDGVEQMWKIIDPIIEKYEKDTNDIYIYSAGSWGGEKADKFIEKDGRKWISK